VVAQFYSGVDPKFGRRGTSTLRQALDGYLADNKHLADHSRQFYRKIVERHLAAWLDQPLRAITADMVRARHDAIQKEVAAGGRYNGRAIANAAVVALRVVWNYAAEATPGLPPNPARLRKRQWFAIPRRERLVTADQLPAFWRAAAELPNPIHRDLITLLLFTGLRRSEATGLRWEEVDFTAGMIRIPPERMKGKKQHDLPMCDVVHDMLVARRAIGRDRLVFSSNGKAIDPKAAFAAIAAATGIKVSSHDMRRTFLTVAESTDVSPMALKRLVAHTSGDVTSGYVIMSTERLRGAAHKVADKLKELCGIATAEGAVPMRRP
jgi:integrase